MNSAQKFAVVVTYLYPLLFKKYQTGYGAHPAFCPVGTGDFSLGVKWPGFEADHSYPVSIKVSECMGLYLHSLVHFYSMVLS
jgi:hypothetical protein